jgi:hypothetical protein
VALSPKAAATRRCVGTRRDGQPCRAWALVDAELCLTHSGGHHRGPIMGRPGWSHVYSKAPPCRCDAYQWPHRRAGGLCRWPDPPIYQCLTPAGTHDWPRLRGGLARFKVLTRLYAERGRELARLTGRGR